MKLSVNTMSGMRRDFVASHLRSQIYTLQGVLKDLENEESLSQEVTNEDLRRVEYMLRQLRRANTQN